MSYNLFPVQDTGLLIGSIQGDQSISFQSMKQKLAQLQTIVQDDPAVATVVGVTGGRQANSGFVYISLKPFAQRQISADGVVGAAARQTRAKWRARGSSSSRCRTCARAGGRATRPINTRFSRMTRRRSINGRLG